MDTRIAESEVEVTGLGEFSELEPLDRGAVEVVVVVLSASSVRDVFAIGDVGVLLLVETTLMVVTVFVVGDPDSLEDLELSDSGVSGEL